MTTPLDPPRAACIVALPGLAADNLLAFMALLGLLRALEQMRPDWRPRARWRGRPWTAELLLEHDATQAEIADAADAGIDAIAASYRLGPAGDNQAPPRDVKFTAGEFRRLAALLRNDVVGAALISALSAELPIRRDGSVMPTCFVHLAGQQHFLDRLTKVPLDPVPSVSTRSRALQRTGAGKIREALFAPWTYLDESDGFRWDPADDQRYALRFGDPSKEGAARTVHGANWLAAVGLLSFPCVAGERSLATVAVQGGGQRSYIWPIWTEPLILAGVEMLLAQDLLAIAHREREARGIVAVMRAIRVTNQYYGSVSVAAEA